MIKVILESPYAGDVERNIEYARKCLKHSLMQNEAPICSHLLLTQVLDDTIPEERTLGIEAGLEWKSVADKQVFYIDYGMSKGMEYALEQAVKNDIPTEFRTIL